VRLRRKSKEFSVTDRFDDGQPVEQACQAEVSNPDSGARMKWQDDR
jgi:hypothetical protein